MPPAGALTLQASYLLPSPMPAAYNGSTFIAVNSTGGFKVTVADGPQLNQKLVTAVGYVPNANNPKAVRKLRVNVTRLSWINPLCGLCGGGEQPPGTSTTVQVGGNASVNGAGPTCTGVTPTSAIGSAGTVTTNGTPTLTPPPGGSATLNNVTFPSTMTLSNSDMATLKAMAQNLGPGHYFKGNQTWTSPPKNGLIFVDTPSGNPLSSSSPASDLITVDLSGNWSSGWSGWLIVAGTVYIHGNVTMNGLIYAQADVDLHGIGGGAITGAVISTNRVNTTSTNLDIDIGNLGITYNCPTVRSGGGQLSQNWFVAPGTYREVSGQ